MTLNFLINPSPRSLVLTEAQTYPPAGLEKISSSRNLVGTIVGVDVVLRVGVWPVEPLPEEGAELVALGEVLPSMLSHCSPDEEVILLAVGETLKQIKLYQADFLEKVGVSHVVLDHGATSLKLKDLVRRQVSEGHGVKEGLCVLSQGLLWAEVRPGSDDFEALIF